MIVAQNPTLTATGCVQVTDYYVAAAHLSGKVRWAVRDASVLTAQFAFPAPETNGCVPLLGADGTAAEPLPLGIIVNPESGALRRQRVPARSELRLFSGRDMQRVSRYFCTGAIRVGATPPRKASGPDIPCRRRTA
jgi:hypothetical protein